MFEKLVNSIKEDPEILEAKPLVVEKKGDNFMVLGGNMRLKALKHLNYTEVPIFDATNWSPETKRRFIVKDNLSNGQWDYDLLTGQYDLEELINWGMEGLDQYYIEEPDEKDDEVPETPVEPKSKLGDLYELGEHRVLCGDSTKVIDIEKLLGKEYKDKKVHCISDPPYGIAYDPKNDKYGMIKNDDKFLDYIDIAERYTDGVFIMWTGYQVVDEWIKRIKQTYERVTNMIIWHKGGGGMGDCARTLAQDYEIALVVHNNNEIQGSRGGTVWRTDDDKKNFIKKANRSELEEILMSEVEGNAVWKVKKDNTATYLHPTQKPVEINQRLITKFTQTADIIMDLFLGSGGNLVAAEKTNRKCYGMELDPKYVDVIVQRYVDFTGNENIKLNGEEIIWKKSQ